MPAKKKPHSAPYEQGKWASAFAPRKDGERRYWLVKSEPDVFSFDDLLRAERKTTVWDGVRNSVARNFIRDGMKTGDRVFFYHSGEAPGIVGICEVVRESYPDKTAFDPKHPNHDPKSNPDAPTWYVVDLRAVAQLTNRRWHRHHERAACFGNRADARNRRAQSHRRAEQGRACAVSR